MKRSTKRLIRKNLEFVALAPLGPLGGAIHHDRWPNEALLSNRRKWDPFLGPPPVGTYDRKARR